MTTNEKNELLKKYTEDYFNRTGEHLKMTPCSRWESAAYFHNGVGFWKIVKIVFDFTGWTKLETFAKVRKEERIFRRGLIDFIAVNNGCSYSLCARATDRDHTTVINSVSTFERRLDTELHTRRYFYEVMRYIRDNFHIYENHDINEENIV